jgi:transcriptional regulator with XRE-family HTH domain
VTAPLSPEDAARAVGVRLRQVREHHGLSLGQLQEKSHGRWKPAVIGSYERGARHPRLAQLLELADFFGISREWLIFGGPNGSAGVEAARDRAIDWHRAEIVRLSNPHTEPAHFRAARRSA